MADEEGSQDGLNSPKLENNAKLEVTQRAITSGEQAYRIASKLETDQTTRNTTNALVWSKYNGAQPFDPQAMAAAGQKERHNFPTGFMASIVDRITPVPKGLIDAARYLTSAYLPDKTEDGNENPEAARKTDIMRERITRAIRRWEEWHSFVTELCQELVLSGAAVCLHLDPFTPWPKMFRLDQAFVPEGTKQHARNVAFLSAKDDRLVHEMVDWIKDKSEAEDAGWDIDAAVTVINEALPKRTNDDGSTANARTYEDAIREGNPGASYSGATNIQLWHVFGVEPTTKIDEAPKVTHYILNRRGNHETLFEKPDRFDSITDVVTLFTLEPGNGRFYGSKGIGRKTINQHLAIERMRCRMFDQVEMAGLMVLYTDGSKAPTVQMRVRHPFILLTSDATISQETIQSNVEDFLKADAQLTSLVEQAVGSYIPALRNDEGERNKTAREVSVDASREAESKVAFLARFWSQFAELISAIQRKLLDPDTTDPIAKQLQKELEEEGITAEEMKEFASVPAAEVIQDLTQVQGQQIQAVFAAFQNNPNIDQYKLMVRTISSMAFPQLADDIVLPEQGLQANEIEGMRQQLIETEAILAGSSMPVSPRDPHETHLKTLLPDLQKGLPVLLHAPTPSGFDNYSAGLIHGESHIKVWEQLGGQPEQIKPYQDALKKISKAFEQIAQHHVQNAQDQAPAGSPETPQGPDNGQPVSGQPTDDQNAPQGLEPHLLKITSSIDYKVAPPSIQRQIEAAAGFKPAFQDGGQTDTPTAPILEKQHEKEAAQQLQAAQQQAMPPRAPMPPQAPQAAPVAPQASPQLPPTPIPANGV